MFQFYYDVLSPKFNDQIQLLTTDTVSDKEFVTYHSDVIDF